MNRRIDLTKSYITRSDIPVKLHAIHDALNHPVIGTVMDPRSPYVCTWTLEGSYIHPDEEHSEDLIEVPIKSFYQGQVTKTSEGKKAVIVQVSDDTAHTAVDYFPVSWDVLFVRPR